MALTHAYLRATKSPDKEPVKPNTLLQRVNDQRRESETRPMEQDEGLHDSEAEDPGEEETATAMDTDAEAAAEAAEGAAAPAAAGGAPDGAADDEGAAAAVAADEAPDGAADRDSFDGAGRPSEAEAAGYEEEKGTTPLEDVTDADAERLADERRARAHAHAAVMDDISGDAAPETAAEDDDESESEESEEESDEEESDEEESDEEEILYDSDGKAFVWKYDADGIRRKRRPGSESDDESDEESEEEEEPEPIVDASGRELVEVAAINDRELLDYSDLKTFSHLFQTVDVDKKGWVRHKHINDNFAPLTSRGINPSQVRQVFECADHNSEGGVSMGQFLDFIGGKPPWYRDWLRHVADTQQSAFLGGMRGG